MVERFFFSNNSSSSSQTHSSLLPDDRSHPIMLLSGPPSSGKTSLLFQFAFNSAAALQSNNNRPVVFICNRRKLLSKPPFLSQGIDPSSHVFQRIQMKYVDDDDEGGITKYFAAFHLHPILPASVIIDDFGDFFDDRNCQDKYNNPRGRDLAIVKTLALCHNAITHAANETGPCKLLLSDTHHGDSPRLLYIYKRWVSSIYTIKALTSSKNKDCSFECNVNMSSVLMEGDDCGSFLLKSNFNSSTASLDSQSTRSAKYSIALQYLVFEGISADAEQ